METSKVTAVPDVAVGHKYPIAEIFTSPQGEGIFSGTLMCFVRLAGCSVGKKLTDEQRKEMNPTSLYELPVYTELCRTHDGRAFLCDTDFRPKAYLTPDEIVAQVPQGVTHICLTGGEPLNHDLTELLSAFWKKRWMVHIETSGTVEPRRDLFDIFLDVVLYATHKTLRDYLWITVSPKYGVLPDMMRNANEIKLLVDEHFDLAKAIALVYQPARSTDQLIFIQPINYENQIHTLNVKRCLEIQQKMPDWRISLQSHKVMNVR